MTIENARPVSPEDGPLDHPHMTHSQVIEKLDELETATGQRRIDLIAELAWRPAWAIRSRHGVISLFRDWWRRKRQRSL